MDTLVSTQWLAERLGDAGLAILDASAHLPDAGRDAAEEFAAGHIPGARFLDLKGLYDPNSPVPSALPTAAQFGARLGALGVSNDHRIVLYDNSALRSSARAWFMFRRFGMNDVLVLDGGLPKWQTEGRPLAQGQAQSAASSYLPGAQQDIVRDKDWVLSNIVSGAEQLVDARSAARFRGEEGDFRSGVSAGHIPGSRNLPFGAVLREDGTFKDAGGIREAFEQAGVNLNAPITTTCGSGITASVLLLALHLIGKEGALYDGSWSEWGAAPFLPVATGEAQ